MTDSHTASGASGSQGVAQFGYTESLERTTGRFASFAVAFAFVSIATGIFTTYGSVLNSSGPMGIWTWPVVIVGQLAVALLLFFYKRTNHIQSKTQSVQSLFLSNLTYL